MSAKLLRSNNRLHGDQFSAASRLQSTAPETGRSGQRISERSCEQMRIFITGVGCIGKTTIGEKLAVLLDCPFFDLDAEIEGYFGMSIERLQRRFLTPYSYRKEASKALSDLLSREESNNCVIALPPSGLMDAYWRAVKNVKGITIVLHDTPENILDRITFYDIDSKPVEKKLSDREKQLYLKDIRGDISYFRTSYRRATGVVDIAGLKAEQAAEEIRYLLTEWLASAAGVAPE